MFVHASTHSIRLDNELPEAEFVALRASADPMHCRCPAARGFRILIYSNSCCVCRTLYRARM